MEMQTSTAVFFCYLGGLALASLAGLALVDRRRASTCARTTLAVFSLAQAIAEWLAAAALFKGSAAAFGTPRLLLALASVVALIELTRSQELRTHRWLLGRWAYLPLAGLSILCVALGRLGWLDVIYRVLIALEIVSLGVVVLKNTISKQQVGSKKSLLVATIAVPVWLLARCFEIHELSALAAVACLGSQWFSSGCFLPGALSDSLAHEQGQATAVNQRRGALQRWGSPAAFLLLVALGWFGIAQIRKAEAEQLIAQADRATEAIDGQIELRQEQPKSKLAAGLWRCGLAIGPLVLLFGGLWLASYAAGVHRKPVRKSRSASRPRARSEDAANVGNPVVGA